jgi:lambda family phage minor tail protein L
VTVPVSDLQAVAPSAIIELFELALDSTLHGSSDIWRFHNGSNTNNNGAVIWNGNTYMRYPVECEGFEYNNKGTLPQPKLRLSNIMGTITALLLTANATTAGNDLIGAKLTRIRTLAKYLDAANFPGSVNPYGTPDPTVEFPREVYFLSQKSTENRDVVEFTCSASFDLQGVNAPKRQCISNICQWTYKGTECGYSETSYFDANDNPVNSSALDACGKRLSSCKARFAPIRTTGSVTKASTTMTVVSTAKLTTGQPIYGFGVATGATVSSITNSTTLVMSAAATGSTTQTQSATPSATAASMTVTTGANLLVGMSVSGTYIPSGTTISAISGNTVTLNQRPYSFSRSGTYDVARGPDAVKLSNTSGITVGMRVFGSLGIDTTVASVTTNTGITLTTAPATPTDGAAVTLYFMPASPSAATYTFGASNAFTFRTTDGILPYGSFPAVGLYLT